MTRWLARGATGDDGRRAFPAPRAADAMLLATVVVAAWALKRAYATATLESLEWVLMPTTELVEFLTGAPFVRVAGEGYLSRELGVIVVPACAGVNFLITAFAMLAFTVLPALGAPRGKVLALPACAAVAYAATVLVNAARIALGPCLRDAASPGARWSPADLHRAEGVVVYLVALWALFVAADRCTARRVA